MTCVHKVKWSVKRPEDCRFRLSVSHYKDRIVAPDEYSGVTVVTPSDAEQVLATKDKLVRDDIKINPAPEPDLRSLAVSENGTYEPDDFDGYSDVTVDVLSVIDNLLEVVSSVTPSEDTKSLEFPCNIKTGMYIIVSNPPGTREFASQQTASETLSMTEFDIRGVTGGSHQCQGKTICCRKTPTTTHETDWWSPTLTLGENSITVDPTSGRYYLFLAGVTYYLLRVKGA